MEDLKDLIINTLDAQGTLGEIRAQLRMLVFKSIDNEGKQVPYDKTPAMQLAESEQGRLCVELLRDFFAFFKLNLSLNVLVPETRVGDELSPEKLRELLGFRPEPGSPILFQILEKISEPDSVPPVKPMPVPNKPKAFEPDPPKPTAQREAGFGPSGMLPIATQAKPGPAAKPQPREEEKEVVMPPRTAQGKDLTVGIQGESGGYQPGLGRAQANPAPSFNFPSAKDQPKELPKEQPKEQPKDPFAKPQKQPEAPAKAAIEIAQIPPFKQSAGKQQAAESVSSSMQASTLASAQLPEVKKPPPKLAPLKEPAPAAKPQGKRMGFDDDDTNEHEKERLRDIGRALDDMQRADKLGKQVDIKSAAKDFDFGQSGEE